MALMQWVELPPEDTTWEDWESLQAAYHLEDKVFFYGEGDDRIEGPGPVEGRIEETNTVGASLRPKRITIRPKGWDDYVH